MDWKKIAPWNWFREENSEPHSSSVASQPTDPFVGFGRYIEDQLLARLAGVGRAPDEVPLRPKMDISEARKSYTVKAELPGVELDDVAIRVFGRNVVIRAEKRQETESDEEGYHCIERSYGSVQRTLSLPEDADPDGIDATFKNGVLTLRIPKHPARAAEEREVAVQSG